MHTIVSLIQVNTNKSGHLIIEYKTVCW